MATAEKAPRTAKLTEEEMGRGEFVAYLRRQHTRRGGRTFAYVESASGSPTVHWLCKKTCMGDGDVEAGEYGYVECFSCDGQGRTLVIRFRSDRSGRPRVYKSPARALLELSECEDDTTWGGVGRLAPGRIRGARADLITVDEAVYWRAP